MPGSLGRESLRWSGFARMACTWTSSKFDHRAPEGVALFRAFLGDATNQDVAAGSDDELVTIARRELRDVLGITAEPVKVHLKRHAKAMPQYNLGHLERLAGHRCANRGAPRPRDRRELVSWRRNSRRDQVRRDRRGGCPRRDPEQRIDRRLGSRMPRWHHSSRRRSVALLRRSTRDTQ